MKYEIYFTNFGYFHEQTFDTIDEAVEFGKERGYEFSVHEFPGGKMVGACLGVSLTRNYYTE